jgi:NAD(P)H dehydrogenase (quinone)
MNSLLIIAHPNKHSFSHIWAEDYKNTKEEKWYDVRTIDLYEPERKQDYLQLNETNRYLDDPLREKHQTQINRADEIVFFFPLRWFSCPAILQNRFDVNYTQGFAFNYRKNSPIPEKLLRNKSVRIIVTTGGPGRLYKTLWWVLITGARHFSKIDYVGMRLVSWTRLCSMNDYKTPESRVLMREKIKRIADR